MSPEHVAIAHLDVIFPRKFADPLQQRQRDNPRAASFLTSYAKTEEAQSCRERFI
jgi:hypothetical protein